TRCYRDWSSDVCSSDLRVWGKAALFDPARGSAAAWLLTLARRTALNQLGPRRPPTPVDHEPVAGTAEPTDVDAFWLETALRRLRSEERRVGKERGSR